MSARRKDGWLKFLRWAAFLVTLPYIVALFVVALVVKLLIIPFEKSQSDELRDFTGDAQALFSRFAVRHGLTYEVETGRPLEVCWTFPKQPKLSLPLILALQGDELNFGVSDFWSYFFPFDQVADHFEHILDAWVAGDARIAITGFQSRLLQIQEGGRWKTTYWADGLVFPLRWCPLGFVTNEPEGAGAITS